MCDRLVGVVVCDQTTVEANWRRLGVAGESALDLPSRERWSVTAGLTSIGSSTQVVSRQDSSSGALRWSLVSDRSGSCPRSPPAQHCDAAHSM
jgi:hypothetical protein